MTPVTEAVSIPGRVRDLSGRGALDWWVARYEASAHGLPVRWELGGDRPVYAAREAVEVEGGTRFGPGSWLLPAADFSREEVEGWAERWGLEVAGVSAAALEGIARRRQTLPRIALLHTWQNTQDDGAVRYALDTMEIPYTYLPEDRLRDGGLRDRFDVILFPEQGRNARGRQIFEGLDPSHGPLPWEPHPDFPSLGRHSTTPDMTGGMGYEGLAALRDFVETGGTLVALGSASTVPVELGLVRDVSLRDPGALFSPGSIVQARAARTDHPIVWGYEEEFPVFDRFGPYFSVSGDRREDVVLRYAPADQVFLSGLVLGREGLGGHPAVLSVPRGEGNVVLFGIRTLHRNQTRGSFALAWNAVLNWDGLSEPSPVAAAAQDEAAGGAP